MHGDGVSPAAGAPDADQAASSGALAAPASPAPVPRVVAEPHPASGIAEALRTHPVVGARHSGLCERACGGILKHSSEQESTATGHTAGAPPAPAVHMHPSFLEPEKPSRVMHRRQRLSPNHVLSAQQDVTESGCTAAAPDPIFVHPGVRRGSAPERAHSVGFVPCVDQHAHASGKAASRIHSRPPSPAVPVGTAIRAAAGTPADTKAQIAGVRSTPELRESTVQEHAPAPSRRLMFAVSPVEVAERRRKSAETGDRKGTASGARRRMVASPAHTSASSSNGSDVFESDDDEDSDDSQTTMHESGSEDEEDEEDEERGRVFVSSPHLAKPRRRSPVPQVAEAADSPSSPETELPVPPAAAAEARTAEADDTPDPCTAWAILSAESEGSRLPQIWSPPAENTPMQRFSLSVPVTHATTSPQSQSVMPLAVSAERLAERLAGSGVPRPDEDESDAAPERQPNSDSGATSDVSGGALSDDGDDVGLPAGGDLSTSDAVPIFPLTFRRQSDLVGSPPSVQLRQYRAAARVDQTGRRPGIRSAGSTPARPGSMAARRTRSMAEEPEPRPHRAMSFSPRALTFAEGLHAPASVALCRDPLEAEHRA